MFPICDLATYAENPSADLSSTGGVLSDGAVLLYRGRAGDGTMRGGLHAQPSLALAAGAGAPDRGWRLGHWLDVGDLDGDGMAEIAAGAYARDSADQRDAGGVFVVRGRSLGAAEVLTPAMADWSVEGTRSSDNMGHHVRIVDMNGDGRLDLVSGDPRSNVEDSGFSRPGVVRVYRGRDGSLPDASPSTEIVGITEGDRFGQFFDVVGHR